MAAFCVASFLARDGFVWKLRNTALLRKTMPKFKRQLFLWLFLHFQYIDPDFESDQWLFCTQKDIGSVCDIHQKSQL